MPTRELIENWYAEPFTKRRGCEIPGQCDGECDCGCPYNTMTEVEMLPLIEDITEMFPNEWLAFIVPPAEDEDPSPTHGKLVAHSPDPDEIFDAMNTVLWNQCVYTFFNGSFEAMQASYGKRLEEEFTADRPVVVFDQPVPAAVEPIPEKLFDLLYSAIDELYKTPPNVNEASRRLRIAKVRAGHNSDSPLFPILDEALDKLEKPIPVISEVIWALEEKLTELVISGK